MGALLNAEEEHDKMLMTDEADRSLTEMKAMSAMKLGELHGQLDSINEERFICQEYANNHNEECPAKIDDKVYDEWFNLVLEQKKLEIKEKGVGDATRQADDLMEWKVKEKERFDVYKKKHPS